MEDGMTELSHWIDGKHVSGTSGRFADVFNPATGEVQARVPLASKSEMDDAVARAAAAQVKWGATNPQKRARVMMAAVALINRDMDKLAEKLSSEHGKTFVDAKGDIQRGLEVIEFCIGAPHLLKGEFTDSAGPGIDMYSMRQPLGVVAGITPFNFPAMIPLWKMGPALACGNAMILKPSERDPSVPLMLAEIFQEAGLPDGVLQVINGDKEAVDAILDNDTIQAVGFVGSTPIAEYIYGRGCSNGKRVQCFGGAKNHMIIMPDADMDQAADALIGAQATVLRANVAWQSRLPCPWATRQQTGTARKAGAQNRGAESWPLDGWQGCGLRPRCDGCGQGKYPAAGGIGD
jgi:malonate-semialdehyde dehydrogenase (acetylating) / methylmalonate-semialdehyde dehydrogenase